MADRDAITTAFVKQKHRDKPTQQKVLSIIWPTLRACCLYAFGLLSFPVFAQEKIEIAIIAIDSGFEVVAKTNIPMTPEQFLAKLKRLPENCSWLDKCLSVRVQSNETDTKLITRTQFKSPWPFKNREMVSASSSKFTDLGVLHVDVQAVKFAESSGNHVVLIEDMYAHWTVEPISTNNSLLTYRAYADPGGAIPSFLVDNWLKDSTLTTMENIRTMHVNSKSLETNASDPKHDSDRFPVKIETP